MKKGFLKGRAATVHPVARPEALLGTGSGTIQVVDAETLELKRNITFFDGIMAIRPPLPTAVRLLPADADGSSVELPNS